MCIDIHKQLIHVDISKANANRVMTGKKKFELFACISLFQHFSCI